jgi:Asp-tRNA(Asn)/Glu-tRNA(Gln) amidotransferase A subunit family amidase
MWQFGMWGWSSLHGLTKNAHNAGYTSGGSSTGTAVGIAAGFARAGLGSDTEGSLRGPADFAGIVGMRVTMGRYSSEGVVPCNIKHDTAGPMASTVADLAVLDAVIMGAAPSDYTPADLKGLTVAFPPDFSSKDLAPGNAKAIALAKEALKKAGATVKEDAADFGPLCVAPEGGSICTELSFRQEGFEEYLRSHPNCTLKTEEVMEQSFYVRAPPHAHVLLCTPDLCTR